MPPKANPGVMQSAHEYVEDALCRQVIPNWAGYHSLVSTDVPVTFAATQQFISQLNLEDRRKLYILIYIFRLVYGPSLNERLIRLLVGPTS